MLVPRPPHAPESKVVVSEVGVVRRDQRVLALPQPALLRQRLGLENVDRGASDALVLQRRG